MSPNSPYEIIASSVLLRVLFISGKDMKKIISHFLSDLGQNGDRVSEKDRKDQYLH